MLGVRLMLGKIRVNVRRMSGPWKAAWPRGQAAVQGRKFKAQLESGVAAWPAFIRLPATVSPQSVVSGVTLPSAWLHYAKRFPTKLPQFALTVKMHNMIKLTKPRVQLQDDRSHSKEFDGIRISIAILVKRSTFSPTSNLENQIFKKLNNFFFSGNLGKRQRK